MRRPAGDSGSPDNAGNPGRAHLPAPVLIADAMRRYLLAVALGATLAVLAFSGLLVALEMKGMLPAPAITNSECADEKLAFLRAHPPDKPNLLIIGSSVAWRHFDSSVATRMAPGTSPLNGGFCGLRANQIAYTANWLIERIPSVKQVIMITAPQDFETCEAPSEVFSADSADAFVFGHASPWPFYFQYFDPVSLARNSTTVADRRINKLNPLSMVFTKYGDGPVHVDAPGLVYGRLGNLDPACFDALRALALALQDQNRPFMVVMSPINPAWQALYDPDHRSMQAFGAYLGRALDGTKAQIWNASADAGLKEAAFTDAIHIRWSAVGPLSEMIMQKLHRANGGKVPPASD